MKKTWEFSQNTIKTNTKDNFKKAVKVSEFHDLKLSSDPANSFMMNLAAIYHPIHVALNGEYVVWGGQRNNQVGKTANLNSLLTLLSGIKIPSWDNQIQIVFTKKSDDYKSLLNKSRKPFQQGGQFDRIKAVGALGVGLAAYPALATLKTDVDNFYIQLNTSYNNQKQNIDITDADSSAVEDAINNMADLQFKNLGLIMAHFYLTPDKIKDYFDVENIRRHEQTDFTGQVKPLKSHLICKRKFALTDVVTLINLENTHLRFYVVSNSKEPVPETFFDSAPLSTSVVTISQIGNVKIPHLMVYNPDTGVTGKWEVKLS